MTRQLRRGFAEKLDERKITKVWRHKGKYFDLVWEKINGVWTPMNDDTYYDDKETPDEAAQGRHAQSEGRV